MRARPPIRRLPDESVESLFARYVIPLPNGCWLWPWLSAEGYGQLRVKRPTNTTLWMHRWSYEHHVGPIPDGMHIDHVCWMTACVNPRHLEPVTRRENTLRSGNFIARFATATHCKHGHPFSGANLRIRPTGGRKCRECERRLLRERRARRANREEAA